MLAFFKKLFLALLFFVIVLFIYQNSQALSTKVPFVVDLYAQGYRYQTPEFPVWILFAVFFLVGMIVAGFHGVYERMARRVEVRRRDKEIRSLRKELDDARSRLAELRPPEAEATAKPAEGAEPAGDEAKRRLESPPPTSSDEEPTL